MKQKLLSYNLAPLGATVSLTLLFSGLSGCSFSHTADQTSKISAAAQKPDNYALTLDESELDSKSREIVKQLKLSPVSASTLPAKNDDLFKLGRELFSDPILSGNRNISCSDCHGIDNGGVDHLSLPVGEGGEGFGLSRTLTNGHLIPRNSPSITNAGLDGFKALMWDGRIQFNNQGMVETPLTVLQDENNPSSSAITSVLGKDLLSFQALFPMLDRKEMRGQLGQNELAEISDDRPHEVWAAIVKRVSSETSYRPLLAGAYPGVELASINIGHLVKAISEFERYNYLVTDTPYDRYLAGDSSAMTSEEKRGFIVFSDLTRANCVSCHSGTHLSDFKFHNVLTPQIGPGKDAQGNDVGRGGVMANQNYKFRTSPLREIARSSPYMHDGAFQSLDEVVEHYRSPKSSLLKYADTARHSLLQSLTDLFVESQFNNARASSASEMVFFRGGLGGSSAGPAIKMTDDEKKILLVFLKKSLSKTAQP